MNIEQLKTTDQVAEILHTSPRAVRRLISDKKIRSAKILGTWLTPIEEVTAYIESNLSGVVG